MHGLFQISDFPEVIFETRNKGLKIFYNFKSDIKHFIWAFYLQKYYIQITFGFLAFPESIEMRFSDVFRGHGKRLTWNDLTGNPNGN